MQPLPYRSSSTDSELERARKENDLLEKKLSKAISKRNYYAKLYYSCMLERDKAMAEREGALKELHKVLTQLHQQGHNSTPTSDSLSDVSRHISDSSSGSNPTPLNPSKSSSLASLLSSFHSHPSTSLHSPTEDSGLGAGGSSTSSLTDADIGATYIPQGTLFSPNASFHTSQGTGNVRNLLEECAEALEGIADLRLGGSTGDVKHVPLNDVPTNAVSYKQKYKQEIAHDSLPRVSSVSTSLRAQRAKNTMDDGKFVKRDEPKFVDTFESQSGIWPHSDGDLRNCIPGNMEDIPTSLLEEYAQDASSHTWSPHPQFKLQFVDPPATRCYRNQSFKLDRIDEMSCESSHSDNSLDQKGIETKVQVSVDMLREKFETETETEITDSTITPRNKKLSYRNLTTHELQQVFSQLSTSRDSVTHLEFYRSSFENEWVLVYLCDEVRMNNYLHTLHLIECALYMAADNLMQVMTAVTHSQLKYLSLARNGLTDGIVDTLQVTEFFKLGLSLALLDLSENFISPEAVSVLISLSQNSKCEIKVHTQYTLTPNLNSHFEIL